MVRRDPRLPRLRRPLLTAAANDQWVGADVHTNTVEGIWSLFKRSIVGSYHHLSAKHLPAYLDEISFRYNNRDKPYLFRDTLVTLLGAEAMPYQELIREKVSESTLRRRVKRAQTVMA
jgi:hypothetical protein